MPSNQNKVIVLRHTQSHPSDRVVLQKILKMAESVGSSSSECSENSDGYNVSSSELSTSSESSSEEEIVSKGIALAKKRENFARNRNLRLL